jgi:hypothetical protein
MLWLWEQVLTLKSSISPGLGLDEKLSAKQRDEVAHHDQATSDCLGDWRIKSIRKRSN